MKAALLLAGALLCGAPAAAFDHDHAAWQRVLEQHAREGLVDYEGLSDDPTGLDAYLHEVAAVGAGEYASWAPEQREAFWINAYNAFTVKAVADRWPLRRPWWRPRGYKYPANSVRQLKEFDKLEYTAAGQEVSLEEARSLAERQSDDARVRFALTCACQGGPGLAPQAFRAAELDAQLEAAARQFTLNPKRVTVDAKTMTLSLSPVYKGIADPVAFVRRWRTEPELAESGWAVKWLPYDWTLDELGTREAGKPPRLASDVQR